MKKPSKITFVISVICVAATVSAISAFAGDNYDESFSALKTKLTQNKAYDDEIIVQVGNDTISRKTLEDFRAHKEAEKKLSNNPSISLKDGDLLEELITEKLLLQKANELNVGATLEDAKREALRVQEILAMQPQDAKDMQARIIKLTGLSEEKYWSEYAPIQYQIQLSLENLLTKLIHDGILPSGKDPNELGRKNLEYRKDLYKTSLGNKVKIVNKSITLND